MIANRDGGDDSNTRDMVGPGGDLSRGQVAARSARSAPRADDRLAAFAPARGRLLGRRARRRHDPRIGICPADGVPGPSNRAGLRAEGCRYIHEQQLPEGGWAIYPGGPTRGERVGQGVLRAEARGYRPRTTRRWSVPGRRSSGWRRRSECNSFTRFYLALLGQIDYDECPSVPPELVLFPSRLTFSLSAMSAWTRTIVVPLSIISAFKPVRRLRAERGIAELFRDDLRAGRRGARRALELGELVPGDRRRAQVGRSLVARGLARSRRSGRRTGGCSTTARTPTAWARSSRR